MDSRSSSSNRHWFERVQRILSPLVHVRSQRRIWRQPFTFAAASELLTLQASPSASQRRCSLAGYSQSARHLCDRAGECKDARSHRSCIAPRQPSKRARRRPFPLASRHSRPSSDQRKRHTRSRNGGTRMQCGTRAFQELCPLALILQTWAQLLFDLALLNPQQQMLILKRLLLVDGLDGIERRPARACTETRALLVSTALFLRSANSSFSCTQNAAAAPRLTRTCALPSI